MGIAGTNLNSRVVLLSLSLVLSTVPSVGEPSEKGGRLVSSLDIKPVIAGELSQIRWSLSESETGKPVSSYLTLTITHLEKGKQIFYLNKVSVRGYFSLGFHFVDASAYRVSAVAEVEGRAPLQEERAITVTGMEPLSEITIPTLFFFLGVIALGLVVGRISRRKWLKGFTEG